MDAAVAEMKLNRAKFSKWSKLVQNAIQKATDLDSHDALATAGISKFDELVSRCCFPSGGTESLGSAPEATTDNFIEWLLSEVEYCSQFLLLASGRVLVNADGTLHKEFLWAPPGHDALLDLDQPVEAGERRLRIACQALRLLVDCPVVAFSGSDTVRWQWRWRCRLVLSISSACPRALVVKQSIGQVFRDDHKLFAVKGKITAKPFIDLLTQHTTRRELYSSGAADIMRRLLEKATGWTWNFNVFCGISYTVDEARDMLDNMATARRTQTVQVQLLFSRLCREAFNTLSFADKRRAMECFYDKEGPVWIAGDNEFESEVMAVINRLCDNTKAESTANELAWFFVVSFSYTWFRLLLTSCRTPAIIPSLIKVLRLLSPVINLRSNGVRVISLATTHLLMAQETIGEIDDSTWARLISALVADETRTTLDQYGAVGVSYESSIIDRTEGVSTIVLPLLDQHPRLAARLLLSILDCDTGDDIKWSFAPPVETDAQLLVNAAQLLVNVARIGQPSDAKFSANVLQPLFAYWKGRRCMDFQASTLAWMETNTQNLHWTLRCFIFGHLRYLSDPAPRIPLPACIVDTLELSDQNYVGIRCHNELITENEKIQCALFELFQLAKISADLAREVLDASEINRLRAKVNSGDLKEPIIVALVDAITGSTLLQDWKNVTHVLAFFFDRLWDQSADVMIQAFDLESISLGVKLVAPAIKLCEAMERILTRNTGASLDSGQCVRNFAVVLKDLVLQRVYPCDNGASKSVSLSLMHRCCEQCVLSNASVVAETTPLLLEVVTRLEKAKRESRVALVDSLASLLNAGAI